jgi:hypothetical protein
MNRKVPVRQPLGALRRKRNHRTTPAALRGGFFYPTRKDNDEMPDSFKNQTTPQTGPIVRIGCGARRVRSHGDSSRRQAPDQQAPRNSQCRLFESGIRHLAAGRMGRHTALVTNECVRVVRCECPLLTGPSV